ncbi:RNA polymerase sigma factor [Alishewanella longhuensis]|uniref:RNA polymerase sigma factor n=1 Tax=Alishewanella longhuensis TaxID=1091037 RepID=A0ABQ3KYP8_9ALTE|nr:sigma-70 family RNA polymerase sigma factor [Alishewanella longhuensis]GHG69687.1 RNA polymerase sigma factor [Alishewanella longhuensis]
MALSFFLPARVGNASSAESLLAYFSRTGQRRYLEQLVAQCGDDLYYFLLKQSDEKMAEEICQQSWLKVLEKHQSFQGNSSFKTWLFTIARNCLLDEFRRQQRWQLLDLEEEVSVANEKWHDDVMLQISQHRQQLLFEQQLKLLPFAQREALILQLEGFSLSEIAAITSQPIETVKSRLRYARQFLQQFCGADNE